MPVTLGPKPAKPAQPSRQQSFRGSAQQGAKPTTAQPALGARQVIGGTEVPPSLARPVVSHANELSTQPAATSTGAAPKRKADSTQAKIAPETDKQKRRSNIVAARKAAAARAAAAEAQVAKQKPLNAAKPAKEVRIKDETRYAFALKVGAEARRLLAAEPANGKK